MTIVINFGARITFVNKQQFEQLAASKAFNPHEVITDRGHDILSARRSFRPNLRKGLTTNVINCIAGGVTNGERVAFFHCFPDTNPGKLSCYNPRQMMHQDNTAIKGFEVNLKRAVKKLLRLGKPLSGVVLGSTERNQHSRLSRDIVLEQFERHKIPYSRFTGHTEQRMSHIACLPESDEWVISPLHYTTRSDRVGSVPREQLIKGPSLLSNDVPSFGPLDIEKHYQAVKLHPSDTIIYRR